MVVLVSERSVLVWWWWWWWIVIAVRGYMHLKLESMSGVSRSRKEPCLCHRVRMVCCCYRVMIVLRFCRKSFSFFGV
ncbi:hypothetical protein F4680DRAFT_419486 [Xylaria scruposa]|nr:hypothetical protein F4680DRAFT_419486 [Xylaria scruposa]